MHSPSISPFHHKISWYVCLSPVSFVKFQNIFILVAKILYIYKYIYIYIYIQFSCYICLALLAYLVAFRSKVARPDPPKCETAREGGNCAQICWQTNHWRKKGSPEGSHWRALPPIWSVQDTHHLCPLYFLLICLLGLRRVLRLRDRINLKFLLLHIT